MNRKNPMMIAGAMLLLCSSLLQGCDRQETIAYFNPEINEDVDNIPNTETGVDNPSGEIDTEEAADSSTENADGMETSDTSADGNGAAVSTDAYTGPEVTLVMVGDILLHTPVAESGVQEDGTYNFDALFANVKEEISAADLALVNQEVIIGGEELGVSGYPSFNAPYELGDALAGAGFDVVLHATNHALDQGKKGVKNCLSFWENNYPEMAVLGIYESQAAQEEIYVYEQDGIRIAILNYTYGTNGIALPSDMPYAVNLLEEERVTEDIAKAKEQADFIIVCPHWGTEYQLETSAEQRRWTNIFLENGVDLVIGTHPHVIGPIAWMERDGEMVETPADEAQVFTWKGTCEDGMLVYYSLGNFVNWTASLGEGIANRMVGGMAEITIGKTEDGEAFILEYGVEPLVCHLAEGTNGVTTYLLSDYTEEMAAENAIIGQDGAFSKEYCEALCEEVWAPH